MKSSKFLGSDFAHIHFKRDTQVKFQKIAIARVSFIVPHQVATLYVNRYRRMKRLDNIIVTQASL